MAEADMPRLYAQRGNYAEGMLLLPVCGFSSRQAENSGRRCVLLSPECLYEKRSQMKKRHLLILSTVAFFFSSVSAFCITLTDRHHHPALSNSLAAVFWITLIAGTVFCVLLAKITKPQKKGMIRLLNFFHGKALVITDTVLVASDICTVVMSACRVNITLLWAVLTFLDLFSMELHCLFAIKSLEVSK